MIDFKVVDIDAYNDLKLGLKNNSNLCCEYSPSNLIAWNVDKKLQYSFVKKQIVFRLVEGNVAAYSIPNMSCYLRCIIIDCLLDAKENQYEFVLRYLSKKMKDTIETFFPNKFIYSYNRDKSDYIYLVEDLIELKGRKYHGKKNHINQFIQNNEYTYEKISKDNIEECRKMKNEWALENDKMDESSQIEVAVVDTMLDHYDQLNLTGGLIRIDGIVKAFTLGEKLSNDTFVTHIEKADGKIRGLYPIINQKFSENELKDYVYVNREEDLGIPGLRKAKLSYNPVNLWDKYEAMLK